MVSGPLAKKTAKYNSSVKKKPPFNQEMSIRGANRRLFARSPLVREKLEESRQEFPRYKKDGTRAKKNWVKRQCEVCNQWTGSSKISIDHVDPVVPPDGFPAHYDMWERITLFLKRLWCDKKNLQRICDDCHDAKTSKERINRLTKQYTDELDYWTDMVNSPKPTWIANQLSYRDLVKAIKKYTAKKKTKGLEQIVQRAQALMENLKSKKDI